jgi:hypothetical protein
MCVKYVRVCVWLGTLWSCVSCGSHRLAGREEAPATWRGSYSPHFAPAGSRPHFIPGWSNLLIAQVPGERWVREQLRDMFISF